MACRECGSDHVDLLNMALTHQHIAREKRDEEIRAQAYQAEVRADLRSCTPVEDPNLYPLDLDDFIF